MYWWFWMLWRWRGPSKGYEYQSLGPLERTERGAWLLEHDLRAQYAPEYIVRWLWTGTEWVADDRDFYTGFYRVAYG